MIPGWLAIVLLLALGFSARHARGQGGCSVPITPTFTEYYGDLTLDGGPAPIGALVEAFNTAGVRAGCFVVGVPGIYGYMRVYGADPDTGVPGMAPNEAVTFKVNSAVANASPSPVLWTGDKGQHEVDLSAVSLPAAVTDLRISRIAGGVKLEWTANGSVHHYELWRGDAPYFSPGAAGSSVIGDGATGNCSRNGSTIACTDASTVGDPAANSFYLVRAFDAAAAAADSNRVGGFAFALQPASP
jgi:hypothetical protein